VQWSASPLLFRTHRHDDDVRVSERACHAVSIGRARELTPVVVGVGANLFDIVYESTATSVGLPVLQLGVPSAVRVCGLALALLAITHAQWARWYLGTAWSSGVRAVGAVRTGGPYKVVRHPIYMSAVWLYIGLILAQDDILGAVVFGSHAVGFAAKAVVEDRVLLATGSSEYSVYASRTPWRLLPGVW
jgi:protein-S-isoprenylcysteine O-methyltransferase Ste14